MNSDDMHRDPAFSVMILDILSNVLRRADDPGKLGTYLAEEILGLTGARGVVLVEGLRSGETTVHRVFSVKPQRWLVWAQAPETRNLYDYVYHLPEAQLIREEETPDLARYLQDKDLEPAMAIPLRAGASSMGGMLIFGLPDKENVSKVAELLNSLSAIVALVLRNSFLFSNQESIIQERTRELRSANQQLEIELTERRRAEASLALRNRINEILLTFPGDEMYGEVLQVVLEVMQSRYGVFTYLDEDGNQIAPSLTRDIWDKCQVPGKSIVFPREIWTNNIWGKITTTKKSVYCNAPFPVPEGHVPVVRALGVAIIFQDEVIGHLLVANKATDYDEQDQERLESIANSIAAILHGRLQQQRLERRRRRAEEEESKLRQQLQQAQKMEAIGRLAGGIAHDFNNILGVINGYSELLLGKREIDESARSRLAEILEAGQRAASLTRQLLAFSRQQILQPKVLSLNLVLENIEKLVRRLIGDDIELEFLLDSQLAPVMADLIQMEQVLLNFCINAREAMPEGGRIRIETANVEAGKMPAALPFPIKPGTYVRLTVTDTGIGMDEETLAHVFEPFFSTKGAQGGTGLGLSTVYGIVEQSGGYLWVQSERGRGSTFHVYLPAAIAEMPAREEALVPRQAMHGSETILLVEDVAPLRALARLFLEDAGYTVLEAENGQHAIEVAQSFAGHIALLLTDVSLPKIKGPALAAALLLHRPDLKVLYVSGYADNTISADGMLPTGTGFLQKPFTEETLARKVRETLDGA